MPIDTAPKVTARPFSVVVYSSGDVASRRAPIGAIGMRAGSKSGTPMVEGVAAVADAFDFASRPAGLSSENVAAVAAPSRTSQAATQRAPLPHCWAWLPSLFQIR